MALIGFAFSNPITLNCVLDSTKWRVVMYMDTPRTLERYDAYLQAAPSSNDDRKVVLFVGGALSLYRVKADLSRFDSVVVFDDVQNLHLLTQELQGFDIVDVDYVDGIYVHKPWTPGLISDRINKKSPKTEDFSFLQKLQNSLGKRRPSVLESTSKMPDPEAAVFSGVQEKLTEIKRYLDGDATAITFDAVLDVYTKYIFRIIPRSAVTSKVTKKLPKDLKDYWSTLTDFAKSDIGVRFAKAFQSLSVTKDPDYRSGYALREYGITQYAGDFVYLSSVLPPSESFEFLKELEEVECSSMNNKGTFKPTT